MSDHPEAFTPRPTHRLRSVWTTGLLVILTLAALGAAGALWTLGARITLSPRLCILLLASCASAAVMALVLTRRSSLEPLAVATARLGAFVALGAALAFPVALWRVTPDGVQQWLDVESPAESSSPRRLRVVQFNVLHDYPRFTDSDHRIAELERSLESLHADIVVLQEAWAAPGRENLARRLGRRLGLHVAYARANGSKRLLGFEEGLAILSRFPIPDSGTLELTPRKHLFDRRIALVSEIAVPFSGPVLMVATHLSNGAPEIPEAQALDLLSQLEPRRPDVSAVLVAGDLNAPTQSRTLGHFRDAGWLGILQGDRDHLLLHADSTEWRPLWSEWVLRPGEPTPSGGPSRVLSDHAAILAELEEAGPPRASRWLGRWQPSAPATDPGVDPGVLERAAEQIGEIEGIESVVIVHDGALVAERYFRGATSERLQNLKSASKGVLSALVGIAISQGHLTLDDPIADHLTEARSLDDPRKASITVRHLLSMKSGLESTSFGEYGSWVSSRNWTQNALERPLRSEPGERFAYSTGNTHLLSAILTNATGQSTLDFARKNLFEPLGIDRVVWERDRQGIYVGGNNLAMRPRDMARFGLLYLDRGLWGDHQVIPWSWVDESTVTSNPGWTRSWSGGYGYLWWLRSPEERGAYNASGFGGQYIFVSRAEDLVLVITSTETSKGREWRRELFSRIRQDVVEPIRSSATGGKRVSRSASSAAGVHLPHSPIAASSLR